MSPFFKKMTKAVAIFSGVLFCFVAGAGTSVGNFKRQLQPEFDFEVRYPDTWALKTDDGSLGEHVAQTWNVANSPVVPDVTKQSHVHFSFLRDFPAKNEAELLKEIKKRYPELVWNPVNNPDFVGFASQPSGAPEGSLRNLEYYLAEPGKVVEIDVTRNSEKNGAAESDLILSTIRKPSIPISVESVTYDQPSYKPGDVACILVHVDAMKVGDKPTIDLELKGELKQWIFREQNFSAESGAFKVCQTMTRAMSKDALVIDSAVLSVGFATIPCVRQGDRLKCRNASVERVSKPITEAVFNNSSPDTSGPEVLHFGVSPDQKGFVLDAQDESGLAFAQIDFQDNTFSGNKRQMILFEDELKDPQHVYVVPQRLLAPGFNLIRRITLFDKIGNVTMLYANNPEKKTYQLVFNHKNSNPSHIPYVSIRKF